MHADERARCSQPLEDTMHDKPSGMSYVGRNATACLYGDCRVFCISKELGTLAVHIGETDFESEIFGEQARASDLL